jgi:hypothetical protein
MSQDATPKPEETKKSHPLGELIKVKVHSLSSAEKKHSIFVSINEFTFDFQQNTEVLLPKGIVKFLQEATRISHGVDEKGFAKEVNEPLYAVSVVL